MAEKENLAKEVSEFIQKSCQQSLPRCLRLTEYFRGRSYPATHPIDCIKCKVFPVITGSNAEFYINPILSCVGDIDIMFHYSNELAIPVGHPPPTQLPADFDNCVKVFEIVDSHIPGYVYLNLSYKISKNNDNGHYVIAEYAKRWNSILSHNPYITAGVSDRTKIHGPSACTRIADMISGKLDIDTVPCVRCLVWPTQADDWPTRHRNSDWPDAATVDRVVSSGCDVVGVAHSLCKEDEWMSKHQWRLSFSRAEIVLLNSWIPVQQTVYHMLRMFSKTERLISSARNPDKCTLSNYHIKTVMLWACELKPLGWWTGGSTLVSLCLQLLQFFNEWFTTMNGQHYFINNVHFFHYFDRFSIDTVAAVVNTTTEDCLARWFVDNYIRKCAELCPGNISLLCSDMVTNKILHDTASAVLKWKDRISVKVYVKHVLSTFLCPYVSYFRSWGFRPVDWMSIGMSVMLPMCRHLVHSRLKFDDVITKLTYVFIDSVNNFCDHPLNKELIDVCALMECCFNHESHRHQFPFSAKSTSLSAFREAVDQMNIIANEYPNNHQSTHSICHIELAKEYLVRALTCVDSDSDSVCNLANVYLTVLYYITGQYQKAADHCTLVTRSVSHPQCSSYVVEGKLLPKIDDDIDAVLGLAVLYQYVRTSTLNQRPETQRVSVFTTELFAHYFNIRHLLVAKCRLVPKAEEYDVLRAVEFHLCEEMMSIFNIIESTPHLFVSDLMLCKFSHNSRLQRISIRTIANSGLYNKQQLAELLAHLPIEQMLSYRQLMLSKDTEVAAVVRSSDFLALRLYRCQLYERCTRLCQRAVVEIIDGRVSRISRLSFMYHEFVRLMDDNIVSLVGTAVLANRSKAQLMFKEPMSISQLPILLFLLTQSQIKSAYINCLKRDISPLADVLDLIVEAQELIPSNDVLDQLILKLTERLAVISITEEIELIYRYNS